MTLASTYVKVPWGYSLMPQAQRALLAKLLLRALSEHICKELEAMGKDPHCAMTTSNSKTDPIGRKSPAKSQL